MQTPYLEISINVLSVIFTNTKLLKLIVYYGFYWQEYRVPLVFLHL